MKLKELIDILLKNEIYENFSLFKLEEINGKFDCTLKQVYYYKGDKTYYFSGRQEPTKKEAIKKAIKLAMVAGYFLDIKTEE